MKLKHIITKQKTTRNFYALFFLLISADGKLFCVAYDSVKERKQRIPLFVAIFFLV